MAVNPPTPPTNPWAKLIDPATATTVLGAILALAIGCADVWLFNGKIGHDDLLIGAGLGALLGVNPILLTR